MIPSPSSFISGADSSGCPHLFRLRWNLSQRPLQGRAPRPGPDEAQLSCLLTQQPPDHRRIHGAGGLLRKWLPGRPPRPPHPSAQGTLAPVLGLLPYCPWKAVLVESGAEILRHGNRRTDPLCLVRSGLGCGGNQAALPLFLPPLPPAGQESEAGLSRPGSGTVPAAPKCFPGSGFPLISDSDWSMMQI